MNIQVVGVRLTEDIVEQIDARAAERGISRSEWVRRAISHSLLTKGGKIKRIETTEETL